ncbi:MAG: hypothetical protein M3021_12550 [Actinomycetota bacterium]|nr:hypothetical protein [Actinomycetota bacterium]
MTRVNTTRSLRRLGVSLIVVATGMLGTAIGVSAQTSGGAVGSVTSGCSSTTSGSNCTFTFTFENANGTPECGQTANFTTTGVPGATVQPSSATVNCNNGQVQAVFEAGSGCGTATITAATRDASVQTTDRVPCPGGGLPNTSTLPPTPSGLWGGLAALAALVIAGGGIALRRMRVTA